MDVAVIVSFLGLVAGLQSFWMNRSLGRVEASVDGLRTEFGAFRAEIHRDLTTHTNAIADLRERMARVEQRLDS